MGSLTASLSVVARLLVVNTSHFVKKYKLSQKAYVLSKSNNMFKKNTTPAYLVALSNEFVLFFIKSQKRSKPIMFMTLVKL